MKNLHVHLMVSLTLIVSLTSCRQSSASNSPTSQAFALEQESGDVSQRSVMAKYEELKAEPAMNQETQYLFDPIELQGMVRQYLDLPLDKALAAIHADLMRRYPNKIMDNYRLIFNNAGAALGQVGILYASSSEYLIFFGSPIPTGGFSGRYNKAEFYDIMIEGEMITVIEGETKRNTFRPGEMAHLPKGVAKGYRLPDSGWMLEYSRGSMISNFPFGVIGPAMYITMDWRSAWNQIIDFVKALQKSYSSPGK